MRAALLGLGVTALLGLATLPALDFAGGGHNDVWMMVLVLGGLALAAAPATRGCAARAGAWALTLGICAYLRPDRIPF